MSSSATAFGDGSRPARLISSNAALPMTDSHAAIGRIAFRLDQFILNCCHFNRDVPGLLETWQLQAHHELFATSAGEQSLKFLGRRYGHGADVFQ